MSTRLRSPLLCPIVLLKPRVERRVGQKRREIFIAAVDDDDDETSNRIHTQHGKESPTDKYRCKVRRGIDKILRGYKYSVRGIFGPLAKKA